MTSKMRHDDRSVDSEPLCESFDCFSGPPSVDKPSFVVAGEPSLRLAGCQHPIGRPFDHVGICLSIG